MTTQRMPAIFFGHGSPMNALQHNRYSAAWRAFGQAAPKPRAILMISAHWYTSTLAVTAMARPRTIHDFGGFPDELFAVQYPAPGDPALAQRIQQLLAPLPVTPDQHWGLDHGTWSVLVHAYPDADIPVLQLSIDATKPPSWHYQLAQRLAPLRDEGVLIAASGNVVHNLGRVRWGDNAQPYDWAQRFEHTVRAALESRDHASLQNYAALGSDAQLSIPTPEHYLPLLYIAAQQRNDERVTFPVEGVELGSIGMLSVAVGLAG